MSNNKKYYRSASDVIKIVNAFEDCTLPVSEWTQISFLTVAFWYSYLNPHPEARRLLETAVRRYAFEHNPNFYEKSAMLRHFNAAQDFLKDTRNRYSFLDSINSLIEKCEDGAWLAKFYTRQIIVSAREQAVQSLTVGEGQKSLRDDYL